MTINPIKRIKYIIQKQIFQVKRKMDKLKKMVKGSTDDPYEVICWGNPTSETYKKATQKYKSSSNQDKQAFLCRLYGKLTKNKDFPTSVAIVQFIGEIIPDQSNLNLPNAIPEVDYSECKNGKEVDLLKKYFNFYYYYVRRYVFRPRLPENIHDLPLNFVVKYFEDSEQNILQIIKDRKIMEQCIKTGTNEQIINITMTWILQNASQDLIRLHKFLRRHWKLIAHNEDFSERLIHCYIKCIEIERNLDKLQKLSALLNCEFESNPYVLDQKLQKTIENQIYLKTNEKNNGIDNAKNEEWKSCTTVNVKAIKNYDDCF